MGGLARRAGEIDKLRGLEHGLVVVDLGDSLMSPWASLPKPAPSNRAQADLMLRALGQIGIHALVPGEAELGLGTAWLGKRAKAAGIDLLAANLKVARRKLGGGKLLSRKLVQTGKVKVGLVAVMEPASGPEDVKLAAKRAGVKVVPPAKVVQKEVDALLAEGAELVVLLAHMEHPSARTLAETLSGVHAVVMGHSGSRLTRPEAAGKTVLVEAGRRGRDIGVLTFRLGKGFSPTDTLTDDSARFELYDDAARELTRLKKIFERGQADEIRLQGEAARERIEATRAELAKLKPPEGAIHTMVHRLIPLDDNAAENANIKALVDEGKKGIHEAPPQGPVVGVPIENMPVGIKKE